MVTVEWLAALSSLLELHTHIPKLRATLLLRLLLHLLALFNIGLEFCFLYILPSLLRF